MKKTVLFGFLGTILDNKHSAKRWESWRPSVALCQHEDLLIDEYHLVYPSDYKRLSDLTSSDIKTVSPETLTHMHCLGFDDAWDFEEVFGNLLDFIKKFNFDTDNNEYLFNITTGTHVAQICIFLLAESRHFPGKLIQSSPVSADRTKSPIGSYSIIDLDLSKYDRIASRFAEETSDDISFLKSGIETKNKAFNSLIAEIEIVASRSKEPVLLTGPTGAGKSMLASRIYQLKKQKKLVSGDFVEVNCATIRGDSAMSALFGHIKGSFTGAVNDRPGLLKRADKGIIFLDEIGELGNDEQAMLLRAIEEKRFISVGSDKESQSDFQLICGTNKDLQKEVSSGNFREDLLARINVWSFRLPGLKERTEDIEPNIKYELNRYTQKSGNMVTFSKETFERFLSFSVSSEAKWKANFRDLNSAVTRMCTLAQSGRITEKILADEIARLKNNWQESASISVKNILEEVFGKEELGKIDDFDKFQLEGVIKICRESRNLSDAGRKLFAVSRQSKANYNDADRLKKYLARFNLSWESLSIS